MDPALGAVAKRG